MPKNLHNLIPALSVPLFISAVASGSVGLFSDEFYARESNNWQMQSRGQDMADIFLAAPVLLISAIRASRKKYFSILIWGGVNMYLLYTYLIFCFSVHFNSMFLLYCINLGLAFYSTLCFLFMIFRSGFPEVDLHKYPVKITGFYFILISVLFYFLWLLEIVPSILDKSIPPVLAETALFTNPVHVIDLSLFLPAVFVTGVALLKKRAFATKLAPAILLFFILMDITIAYLSILLQKGKPETDLVISSVMILLAIFSFILLSGFYRALKLPFVHKASV